MARLTQIETFFRMMNLNVGWSSGVLKLSGIDLATVTGNLALQLQMQFRELIHLVVKDARCLRDAFDLDLNDVSRLTGWIDRASAAVAKIMNHGQSIR